MNSLRLFAAVFVSLVLVLPAILRADEAGDCTGTVRDENGVPVESAQIKFENSSGQSFLTESDGAGGFTLRNLPAGEYRITASKTGFFVLKVQSFTLHSGANQLALTLNHAQELHEKIQVTASQNQIDPEDTAERSTLTARDIRDIPVPNNHVLQQSLITMPEVLQDNSDNLHVAGARSGETEYLLDGFEIGNPVNGALTARFNIDATRAAEVQAARVDASYAHSGASILSLDTPEGDDRWRFGTTNPLPGINLQEGAHLGNWYPRFTFSGPIVRGRFWFADSVSIQHTFAVIKQQPSE
jgi:hypothetical protein